MATKKTSESAKSVVKRAPKAEKTAAAPKGSGKKSANAKRVAATVKKTEPAKQKAKSGAEAAPKRVAKAKEPKAKTKTSVAKPRKTKAKGEAPLTGSHIGEPVLDPIGDTTDGEGRTYTGGAITQATTEMEAFRADTNSAAMDSGLEAGPGFEAAQTAREAQARKAAEDAAASEDRTEEGDEEESRPERGEPGRLERLQKILSQAGIASRRRAEEMIVAGRVMVNGQVVTTLGSKADAARDHIRVDGKLLHGAERHRYFMLNKPRGYVTTVSDPEGRPTVMQFFEKMHERLYPVGRLDFQSEGLLLMSNDGELANLLTKAESGVEKTYLVKVAGQPSAEELERLRSGVAIEKDETGSERVRTAPARIQQVRAGDNPWYEVVLTEGRNRELRKMFAAIGHFAEKIRRVGYGPLVLDVEPGRMRELTQDEADALRLTAEGKMKPRRVNLDRTLPKEAGIPAEKRGKFGERRDRRTGPRDRGVVRRDEGGQRQFGRAPGQLDRAGGRSEKPFRPREEHGQRTEWKPREREFGGAREGGAAGGGERPSFDKRRGKTFGARPESGGRGQGKPFRDQEKVGFNERRGEQGGRPPRASSDFGQRRDKPFSARSKFRGNEGSAQRGSRFEGARKPFRPGGPRPQWQREDRGEKKEWRPQKREFGGSAKSGEEFRRGPRREQGGIRIDRVARPPLKPQGERQRFERSERPAIERGGEGKRQFEGGKSKGFQRGAKFGAKPGGFGKPRGVSGHGRKFGGSRPGGQGGGWKKG